MPHMHTWSERTQAHAASFLSARLEKRLSARGLVVSSELHCFPVRCSTHVVKPSANVFITKRPSAVLAVWGGGCDHPISVAVRL